MQVKEGEKKIFFWGGGGWRTRRTAADGQTGKGIGTHHGSVTLRAAAMATAASAALPPASRILHSANNAVTSCYPAKPTHHTRVLLVVVLLDSD